MRPERPRARVGFLGGEQRVPSPSAKGSKLPQQGPGQSPGKFAFWNILRPQKSRQNGKLAFAPT